MFFIASKVLGFLAVPSNVLILIGIIGVILLATRWRRAGVALMGIGIVLLAIAGFSPLGNALILPLEDRFPPWDPGRGAPDGIVVLGGSVSAAISAWRHAPQLNESAERITTGAALARRYPKARLVFTGGSARLVFNEAKEGDYAEQLLLSLGIPRERLTIERRSRNTWENAVFTKALVKPKPGERWLLVTSAAHMPRAIGIFRKASFPVEAYPVDWRTRGPVDLAWPFYGESDGLARVDVAAHEWIGLAAYWISGRTSAFFPGPAPPISPASGPVNPAAAGRGDTRP
jgi:uncharacterized SAM-binding protein YcdF (DUF218 family)